MSSNPHTDSATTQAVVWIDHHHATFLRVDRSVQPVHVKAHVHPTAQHGSDVRAEHEFFAAVCAQMEPIDAVLVTGSKTVLADLRHYVEKHRPTTARRIAAYEVVDHPTDNQLAAFGREFFERQAP